MSATSLASSVGSESCSISLSASSVQLSHRVDEAFRKVQVMKSGPGRRLMSYLDRLPYCENRQEALRTAFIYVLHVNPSRCQDSFQTQLVHYGYILNELRQQNRRLRPSRAILLVRTRREGLGVVETGDFEGNWQDELEEFEVVHGDICKCGPVFTDDTASIRSIFETVAISRKNRFSESVGSDSDGSNLSTSPPFYEAECDRRIFESDVELDPDLILANYMSI